MIKAAFDTNFVVRLIVHDDDKQYKTAVRYVNKYKNLGEIFISVLVVLETYWVLTSCYGFNKEQILRTFEYIFSAKEFYIEKQNLVHMALMKYKNGLEFEDALIGCSGQIFNVKTYTFDQKCKRDSAFQVVK